MCGGDVDEVLVVQLVVFSEEVHVGGDLGRPGSLHDQSEVGGQRGLVASVVQRRAGSDLRVEPQVGHSVLAELDRHLAGRGKKKTFKFSVKFLKSGDWTARRLWVRFPGSPGASLCGSLHVWVLSDTSGLNPWGSSV